MIVAKQLRRLWKEKKMFVLMLISMQVVAMFGFLFLSGVIMNSSYVLYEDEYTTLQLRVGLSEGNITYGRLEETVQDCIEHLPSTIDSIQLGTVIYAGTEDDKERYDLDAHAGYQNGKYRLDKNWKRDRNRLEYGRMYTEEELNRGDRVAVVLSNQPYTVGERVMLAGEEYEIIGVMAGGEDYGGTVFAIPLTCFRDMPIYGFSLNMKMIITEEQREFIENSLQKVIPGEFGIYSDTGHVPDSKTLARTIISAGVFLLAVILGTMMLLYEYLIDENSYRLGVWKLLGCGDRKASWLYTLEMAAVTLPSLLLGIGLFAVVKNRWLLDLYRYMGVFFSAKIYCLYFVSVFTVIMLLLYLFSRLSTRGKIRGLLM